MFPFNRKKGVHPDGEGAKSADKTTDGVVRKPELSPEELHRLEETKQKLLPAKPPRATSKILALQKRFQAGENGNGHADADDNGHDSPPKEEPPALPPRNKPPKAPPAATPIVRPSIKPHAPPPPIPSAVSNGVSHIDVDSLVSHEQPLSPIGEAVGFCSPPKTFNIPGLKLPALQPSIATERTIVVLRQPGGDFGFSLRRAQLIERVGDRIEQQR